MHVDVDAKYGIGMAQGKTVHTIHFLTLTPLAPTEWPQRSVDRHIGPILDFFLLFLLLLFNS